MTLTLEPLAPSQIDELDDYWRAAHAAHPLEPAMLRERFFAPETCDAELLVTARDGGRIVGLAAGVYPLRGDAALGGVRWLGALPERLNDGTLERLEAEICARLRARGARRARMMATPPNYIRPGVAIAETALIARLLSLGWIHEATNFNMTVDLRSWRAPEESAIFAADAAGRRVRRAGAADRAAFEAYMRRAWGKSAWPEESLVAFGHVPAKLFLAVDAEGGIVGFAAYEVSQTLGSFGPTGVEEGCRGSGLGRRLLYAALAALQLAGRPIAEIGWVGPVAFYHRAAGATLGPVFWSMTREL